MTTGKTRYEIAIVGMGCIFPGALNTEQYWKNIESGETFFKDMPERLWRMEHYYSPDRTRTDKSYTKIGAFVEDFDFPFLEYRLPPASLKGVDSAQLVAMEATKQALKDAGIQPRSEDLDNAITVIGTSGVDEFAHATAFYRRRLYFEKLRAQLESKGVPATQIDTLFDEFSAKLVEFGQVWNPTTIAVGAAPSSISNRLAQVFGVKGFNMTVDGACSSSLIALDVACQALIAGDARVAIAGGVDMGLNPAIYIGFSRVEGLSLTDRSNPFDGQADGLLMGEGAGILVLKKLEDALEDGDRIHAVVRGVGSSSDGAGQAIYTPSMEGRTQVLQKALARSHTEPSEVQYIEAHATSTVVGDANEYDSISVVYGKDRNPEHPVHLGSVKHQIGHLKAAAGVAGLIKTVLAMEHETIPHLPRFQKLTPRAQHPNAALVIPTRPQPWEKGADGKRVGAVTTSGFGGVNYHCILERADHYTAPSVRPTLERDVAIVGISVKVAGADDADTFWDNISSGKNVFQKITPSELGWERNVNTGPDAERITTGVGGRINPHDFQPLRYKIFPNAVSQISPTQLLALDLADQLVTGQGLKDTGPQEVGVSIGSMHDDFYPSIFTPMMIDEYAAAIQGSSTANDIDSQAMADASRIVADEIRAAYPPSTEHTLPGWMTNITPGRISNRLNLCGPNFTVDTACSSGLSSLIPAMYQLMFGNVDYMISGGINRQFTDVFSAAVSQLGAVAAEVARPYDAKGKGFLIGEGGVLFLLKRLEDARRDGDTIHAVVHSVSGSSEAESKSMVAPSEVAVRRGIRNALAATYVPKEDIGVVDTHGSANLVSDVVEAHSIAHEIATPDHDAPVQITAIKSHIGHLYGGSGATSLLSTIKSLKHRQVPGIRNLETPRPELADILGKVEPRKGTQPLSARVKAGAVSSIGLGGSNYFGVVSVPSEKYDVTKGREQQTPAVRPPVSPAPPAHSGQPAVAQDLVYSKFNSDGFIDYLAENEPSILQIIEAAKKRYRDIKG